MSENIQMSDFRQSVGAKLIAAIVSAGYTLGSTAGLAIRNQDSFTETYGGGVAILHRDPRDKPRHYLFGLIKRASRRRHLATVWTDNTLRGATEKSWVVEVYGRDDLPEMIRMLEGLAEPLGARLSVGLKSDNVRYETRLQDYFP